MGIKENIIAAMQAIANASGDLDLKRSLGSGADFELRNETVEPGIAYKSPGFLDTLLEAIAGFSIGSGGSSTDNAVVRWNGVDGTAIQNSGVTLDDNNNFDGAKTFSFNTLYDNGNSSAAWTLTLSNGQYQEVTLNSNTVSMTIDATGITGPGVWTIIVKQDATGGRSITTASISGGTVYSLSGEPPTYATGSSAICCMVIFFDGTDVYVQVSLEFSTW